MERDGKTMGNAEKLPFCSAHILYLTIVALVAANVCGCSRANTSRERAMIRAVDTGDYAAAEQLLKHYPSLANAEITEGELNWFPESVLVISVKQKHTKIAELLIRKGADVNYKDWSQLTALHYAAERGDICVMNLLLAKGADPNATDEHGLTPIMLAVEGGQRDAISLLKRVGVKPGSKIHEAAALGDLDAVRAEVERDPRAANSQQNYWSPVSLAARNGHLEVVEFLAKNGAHVDAQAFREAARSGNLSMVRFLRARVTDLDSKGGESTQYTALQVAAMQGHRLVVEYLLAQGADPTVKTRGFTTVELTRRAGHNNIAELLLRQPPSK